MELIRVTGKKFLYENTRSNYYDSIFCLCKLISIYKISALVNFRIYIQNIEHKVPYHKKLKCLVFTFLAGKRLKSLLNVKRGISSLVRVCDITGSWNVVSELILSFLLYTNISHRNEVIRTLIDLCSRNLSFNNIFQTNLSISPWVIQLSR